LQAQYNIKMSALEFWNELNKAQKADIEAGLVDLEKGNKKDFDKVIVKYKSKFNIHNSSYISTSKISTFTHQHIK
jgi:predicted transcriptional regulator